ncbi:MAG: HNH endonuclease [Acidobacteria bacterium]|nr:HNH endonuclease [Acidobacteriota bacterium]
MLENPNSVCVFCRGEATQLDHAIPKSWGGNATLPNAQRTCAFCNQSKGARGLFPINPPPRYTGPWPPPWWK